MVIEIRDKEREIRDKERERDYIVYPTCTMYTR
jgi:hypothetical protein